MEATDKRGRQDTGAAVANNLPHYLTSFVGRAGELAALKSLLARSRMVTITGPGGAGKSRLAVELSRACPNLWPDGIWWVELAPVSDPNQVAGAVISSLGLTGRGPAQDVAIAWLAARRALVVLDNCEHLIAACAEFCRAALEHCPQLTIIATSREGLSVPGETHSPVSSLRGLDAVHLFGARAALAQPNFKVTASNLDSVTEICERIDRLPLAIELAAARVGIMTEQEMLSQLSDRFHLLAGGNRTAPERQQTMIATIDWSYRLLTEEEAQLFRRLAVFRGGFTFESAQVICADAIVGGVLDLLAGLVQKSMVVAERTGSGTRYRLLESQLAYAEDRLREADELETIRRRHYEYYLDRLVTKMGPRALPPRLAGIAEAAWVARERANLWATVGWARRNAQDMGLLLAVRLTQSGSADITARRTLLVDLLEHSEEQGEVRADAFTWIATLAFIQGDYEAALHAAEAGVALARELEDVDAVAYALLRASMVKSFYDEDLDTAAELLEEAASLLKYSTNSRLVMKISNNLGLLAVEMGDYLPARDRLIECVQFARAECDVSTMASYLDSLAWSQLGLDDHAAAAASWKEVLSISRSVLDDWLTVYSLYGLSYVASASRNDQRGLRLAAAASRLSDERSYDDPFLHRMAERFSPRSRLGLGTRKSNAAWNQGRAMSVEQVVAYALNDAAEPIEEEGPLTRREMEIAALVACGHRNREIAERLTISRRTVDAHIEHIRNKLGYQSRAQVAAWATEHRRVKN